MTLIDEPEIIDLRLRRFSFTVEQYHEMLKNGIIEDGEPYELLHGQIILKDRSATGADPMTVSDDHTYSVMKLTLLNTQLARQGCHLRPQQPILLPPASEPEPDGAIVNGTVEDYAGGKPGRGDVQCLIEVSDSSLGKDRTSKLVLYANAGIPTYFIINLAERVVEVYAEPMRGKGRFARTETLYERDRVSFPTGKRPVVVPVKQLLPPARSNGKPPPGKRR